MRLVKVFKKRINKNIIRKDTLKPCQLKLQDVHFYLFKGYKCAKVNIEGRISVYVIGIDKEHPCYGKKVKAIGWATRSYKHYLYDELKDFFKDSDWWYTYGIGSKHVHWLCYHINLLEILSRNSMEMYV